jgi:putative ABC transport system permease protein
MLKTYLTTAWRSLSRNKVYSALNISGLAIGMAVALLIGLWVNDQYSYDRWLPGYRQAFQVRFNYNDKGVIRTQKDVCRPLEDALKHEIRGVGYASPVFGPQPNTLTVADKKIHARNLVAGDGFLQIFQFPMLKGNRAEALKNPHSVVLTERAARALFGDKDPINQVVRIYDPVNFDNDPLKVTGVLKDLPLNSTFQFDYITPLSLLVSGAWARDAKDNWADAMFEMYIGLEPNADPAQVQADAKMLVQKNAPAAYRAFQQQVLLQPLKDWHLFTNFQNGRAVGGIIDYLRLFSVIGVLVLFIACINFMNLSTARSQKRAREVGVRKVIGSSRGALIRQFLAESLLFTVLGFVLSLILVQVSLPAFNRLTGSGVGIPWSEGGFWLIMAGYVLLTALLAGSRPAFYLSSFQPVQVLRGGFPSPRTRQERGTTLWTKFTQTAKSAVLSRKGLVVLQFTCSIGLIIGTIIVYQQIQYARNRSAGYDPNRLVESGAGTGDFEALKHAALASGVVSGMTKTLSLTTEKWPRSVVSDWQGRGSDEPLTLLMNAVADSDYFKTLGMGLKEGRNFTGNYPVDSSCTILNETAVRMMHLQHPVGTYITWMFAGNNPQRVRVVGVVKDALIDGPFGAAAPAYFLYQPGWTYSYTYRLAPTVNTGAALATLKPIFDQYDPSTPFEYHFVDEEYAGKFSFEVLIGQLAAIFTGLAIFICCLGLFGLAAFMAEQRTKEIGIRKVLGASVTQVLLLLTKDFILLVGISCLIASPIAFYFVQNWLHQYYYRISIGPGVFVVSAILAIVIAVATVSFQAIKAALMNPTRSLRSE